MSSLNYRQSKAIGDWHRKRAHRLRVLSYAVQQKLTNPYAEAHPQYVRYCNELLQLRRGAWRHTQLAGNFSN